MKTKQDIVLKPIFFQSNRVFRVYLGGAPFSKFFDSAKDEDTMFPEEWIASKVKAINPKYFTERDGVSLVKDTDFYLDDLLAEFPDEMLGGRKYDCLVKLLDSAIRLPVQVHPTKEDAKKKFGSDYGKTEAWLVVATRPNAKIYFGFNREMTKEELSDLEVKSETERDIMSTALASVPARVGDVWLIKAGLIHAIGAGCTILEVQEPTDFTIQPENWCGDYHISDHEKYIGLTKSDALDCFDYSLVGEKAIASAHVDPKLVWETELTKKETLIDYNDTPCFALNRYTLNGGGEIPMTYAPSVWLMLEGAGEIVSEGYKHAVKKGDYFYLPYAAEGKFLLKSEGKLVAAECLPSKQ